jgi:hypothetical protein
MNLDGLWVGMNTRNKSFRQILEFNATNLKIKKNVNNAKKIIQTGNIK